MSTGQLLDKTAGGVYRDAQGPNPQMPKNLLSSPSLFLSCLLCSLGLLEWENPGEGQNRKVKSGQAKQQSDEFAPREKWLP